MVGNGNRHFRDAAGPYWPQSSVLSLRPNDRVGVLFRRGTLLLELSCQLCCQQIQQPMQCLPDLRGGINRATAGWFRRTLTMRFHEWVSLLFMDGLPAQKESPGIHAEAKVHILERIT